MRPTRTVKLLSIVPDETFYMASGRSVAIVSAVNKVSLGNPPTDEEEDCLVAVRNVK